MKVYNYLGCRNKVYAEMSTTQLVLELFCTNRQNIYQTQNEIVQAIKSNFSVTRTQGAISKALKKIENVEIHYNSKVFIIQKIEDSYRLYTRETVLDEQMRKLAEAAVFKAYTAYSVAEKVVAYTIHEKQHIYTENCMRLAFGEDAFFDVISHEDKLYFLLNDGVDLKSELMLFPKRVEKLAQEYAQTAKKNHGKKK